MWNLTHVGTVLSAALLLAGRPACSDDQSAGDDASSQSSTSGDSSADAQPSGSCSLNQECTLVPKGCCAACNPGVDDVRAVLVRDAPAACEAACGPCAELSPTDIVSQLRAACVAGACQVEDLRAQALTECAEDSDCELRSRNCCNGCGDDPALWLSVRKGAPEPSAPECTPIPPCAPCPTQARPVAYCAPDKHCAARPAYAAE